MEPFAWMIDAAKKYVVSSTLDRVDWNAELVRGDLGKAVEPLREYLEILDQTIYHFLLKGVSIDDF